MHMRRFLGVLMIFLYLQNASAWDSWASFTKSVTDKAKSVGNSIENTFNDVKDGVVDIGQKVGNEVSNAVNVAGQGLKNGWEEVAGATKNLGNAIENKYHDVKEGVNKLGQQVGEFIDTGVRMIKVEYGKYETKFVKLVSDAKQFMDDTIKEIVDFGVRAKKFVMDIGEKIGEVAMEAFDEAKKAFEALKNLDLMDAFCNQPAPAWVTAILDAKDKICNNPVSLMGIKDTIMIELRTFKTNGDEKVLKFAREFTARMKEMTLALQSKDLSKIKGATKDMITRYNKIKVLLLDFVALLEVAKMEIVDDILSDASDIAEDSKQLLELFDSLGSNINSEMGYVKDIVSEVRTLTHKINDVTGAIVKGVLGAIETASELCEKVFDLIKTFISEVPENAFGGEDDDDENLTELKGVAKAGTGVLLQTMAYLAEEALNMGIAYIEKILDAKKSMACGVINSKINIFLKIRDFACGAYFNKANPTNNLLDKLNAAEKSLDDDMKKLKNALTQPVTNKNLKTAITKTIRSIENNPSYRNIQLDVTKTIRSASSQLNQELRTVVAKSDVKLLTGILNQLEASVKSCKNTEIEFNTKDIDIQICDKTRTAKCFNEVPEKLLTIVNGKIDKIIEGKAALAECAKKKSKSANKKFNALKKGAKKMKG